MSQQLGVILDPLDQLQYKKDSSIAMLLEAQTRHYTIYSWEIKDLYCVDGKVYAQSKILKIFQDPNHWYEIQAEKNICLDELDVILIRKNPPFDDNYLYVTQLLDNVKKAVIVNRPQALRDANEKLYIAQFPQCTPPTLVTQSVARLTAFLQQHKKIVCKPLNAMGGQSIFCLHEDDINSKTIFETLTNNFNSHSSNHSNYVMAQLFIPEIKLGDKRIILVDGKPIPHVLARIPSEGDWRGNLATGAKGVAQPLTKRDQWICDQVGPTLRENGILFAGLDVIGDYLTEINVTSPTGIRQLDEQCKINISGTMFDAIEKK